MARILLVDDDSLIRAHARSLLEEAGHEVVEAKDGREGVERYERHRPDLVITDIIMPGQEGVETIAKIRRLNRQVPIIAVSSGGPGGSGLFLQLAQGVGATRTVRKPLEENGLLQVVSECLAEPETEPGESL